MTLAELVAIARGDRPAELVLRGGRVVNVLSAEVHDADVAVVGESRSATASCWRRYRCRSRASCRRSRRPR